MNCCKKIDPDELFVQLLIGEKFRPLRHISLAVMILGLGLGNINSDVYDNWSWLLNALVFIPLPILLNVYVFVPRFLLADRPYMYILALTIVVLLCLIGGNAAASQEFLNGDVHGLAKDVFLNALSTLLMFSLIIAGTTSMIILQMWLRDRIRIAQLEEASNIAELEMLKNQINPHFLFNMLNNSIVLSRENSSQAGEVIIKLREMLNYQFEMSHVDRIPLRGEVDFLNDLLHLEKIRRDRFDYHILVTGDADGVEIPPLLFIPFVENAIKHGNDNTRLSYILLVFNVSEGKLNFFCTNSLPGHAKNLDPGGLGLKNIKRRLELIYGKEHSLIISSTGKTYNVQLTIGL